MRVQFAIPDRLSDMELVGYLKRWSLAERDAEGKAGRYYLHNIVGPDKPFFHDHPWDFRVLVLSGGYIEMQLDEDGFEIEKAHLAGETREIRAERPHFIKEVFPQTWTLVVTSPVKRDWGFWHDETWIHHREFEGNRDVEVIFRNGYGGSTDVAVGEK